MKIHQLFLTNLDNDVSYPQMLSKGTQDFGLGLLSHFNMLLYNSRHAGSSGRAALHRAHTSISEFAGTICLWLSTVSSSPIFYGPSGMWTSTNFNSHQLHIKKIVLSMQKLAGLAFSYQIKDDHALQVLLARLMNSMSEQFWSDSNQHHVYSTLALDAALVPPTDYPSREILPEAVTVGNCDAKVSQLAHQSCGRDDTQRCNCSTFPSLALGDAIEPKTGTKFPSILGDYSNLCSEVLVGMGFRSMRIIRSINLYAFGLYVQPSSICQKLGHKYASIPRTELKDHPDFYNDLLRENIGMSVRLVVNCNGLKVDTVRDAFEKSLRIRLQKMKPNTDYLCLKAFSSCFDKDIPIPIGTTIDFRQTSDGSLITEIDGKYIGVVHSKDLCSAFFDMYIGDPPVSQQAKHEIAQNVADLIRKC